jgi:hypothetical protein
MFGRISAGTVVGIIKLLLSVVDRIMGYAERKQLMDAGAAKQQRDNLEGIRHAIKRAVDARNRADAELSGGGVPSDYRYFR